MAAVRSTAQRDPSSQRYKANTLRQTEENEELRAKELPFLPWRCQKSGGLSNQEGFMDEMTRTGFWIIFRYRKIDIPRIGTIMGLGPISNQYSLEQATNRSKSIFYP